MKARILLVDDDPIVLKYLEKALSPHYTIYFARNGAEGLKQAIQEKPDMVISDLYMPEMDGDQLAREIKKIPALKETPFIMITSSKDQKEKLNHLKEVDEFIYKPFDPRELLLRIGNLLKMTSLQREIREDLFMAQAIQNKILKGDLAQIKDLNFEMIYRPQNMIGGDIYHISRFSESRVRIFLADAAGHGVQAALMTMLISSEYQRLKSFVDSPAQLLQILNNEWINFYSYLNLFFTCVVLDIDLNEKKITYSHAGHPEQLVFLDQKELKTLKTPGKMIGIQENAPYQNHEIVYQKNFQLFLFSDGLIEQFNEQEEIINEEFLSEIAVKPQKNIQEKVHQIMHTLHQKMGSTQFEDDLTLIGVENKE